MKSRFSSSLRIGAVAPVSSQELQHAGLSISARTGYLILASVLAPFFLLIAAWRTRSSRYRHWLLTAFVTMYGATITIQFDPTGAGADGVRHLLLVHQHYVGMGFYQFLSDLWSILTFSIASDPAIRDVYKHVISYLVGGVLGQPQFFFVVVAAVYGYFFVGSMMEILKHVRWKKHNYLVLGFAVVVFFLVNIEAVNTVRTWTGMWVLVYACLRYYDTKKTRYLILMLAPPLIHFGFFLMLIPALVVLVLGNKVKLYAALFLLSSGTTLINPGDIVDVIDNTERGAAAVQGYYVEEQRSFGERREMVAQMQTRWWNAFRFLGVQKWALNILIYTLIASGIYFLVMQYRERTLFSIGLLTLTMSNSMWFLFALSNRTWTIGCLFVLASFVMARTNPETAAGFIRNRPEYYKWGINLSLLLFTPFLLFKLSLLINYVSVFMFVVPFLVWVDPDMNMSIKYVLQVLLGVR